jgi:hypothetical protein
MTRKLTTVIAAVLLSFLVPLPAACHAVVKHPIAHTQKEIPATVVDSKDLNVGVDGYLFEGADYLPKTDFKVKMVYSTDLTQLRKNAGVPTDSSLVAYTIPPSAENGNTCEIHIVDPRHQYWPEYIGHEFVHCLVGNFHRHQDVVGKFDPTK